jgi:hypothetical protein
MSLLTVVDSTLAANTAADGGGLYLGTNSAASLVAVTVEGNVAIGAGGGVACVGCSMLRAVAYVERNRASEVRLPLRLPWLYSHRQVNMRALNQH